ncbi:hypothetical protein [Rhodoferax sp.]|uniref:hypothetical protein n=1 Tax=Rhodoferax sp. TaxID=50421 RepID=UPI002ACE2C6F|nr:hypothetical protein [Rhodoferax sp.]MDZ7920434.1 hypothetical protein [Rhodoferax sp.]
MRVSLGYMLIQGVLWGLAALAGVCCSALAWLAWTRAQLPYSENGSYLDGDVVVHEQAVAVYAVLALGLLGASCGAAWGAYCLRRKRARPGRE